MINENAPEVLRGRFQLAGSVMRRALRGDRPRTCGRRSGGDGSRFVSASRPRDREETVEDEEGEPQDRHEQRPEQASGRHDADEEHLGDAQMTVGG